MKTMLIICCTNIFLLLTNQALFCQADFYRKDSIGDIVSAKSNVLPKGLESIFININYRQYSIIKFSEDSVNYEFEILNVEAINKTRFKIRIAHKPVKIAEKPYLMFYDSFIGYYEIRIKKNKVGIAISRVRYIITEL